MFSIVLCFMKKEIPLPLQTKLWCPLSKVLEYKDQQCLGLFLLEVKRPREMTLDNNTATMTHTQRAIATFFSHHSSHYKAMKGYKSGILT